MMDIGENSNKTVSVQRLSHVRFSALLIVRTQRQLKIDFAKQTQHYSELIMRNISK